MVLCSLLIFILAFNQLVVDLDAWTCPKGEKVSESKKGQKCVPCDEGYFQPTENTSKRCKACNYCKEGSTQTQSCTKQKDAECKCRQGFVPYNSGSIICKCDKGYEEKQGECSKCRDGYFSPRIGTTCRKWKDCTKEGVKINGTPTSDVVCNEEKGNSPIATVPSPSRNVSVKPLETHPRREGTNTLMTHFTTTRAQKSTETTTVQPPFLVDTGNHLAKALPFFGIGLVLVLTAVTCKLCITPCWKKRPTRHANDSHCRRPVEESCETSESFIKLNPEP
ncbi:tumor necrosis factor receptor superfamily member 4 [Menidia menidia]|uniref:(Atlantic silverside) hypothetical protein n=1 Tax=Menidia menidia TaxID=238744 RepID=A0A8S4BKQ2_9TELE|nr:unnamed protein product [Menidia menidia]